MGFPETRMLGFMWAAHPVCQCLNETTTTSVVTDCKASIVPKDSETTKVISCQRFMRSREDLLLRHATSDRLFPIRLDQTNRPINAEAFRWQGLSQPRHQSCQVNDLEQ